MIDGESFEVIAGDALLINKNQKYSIEGSLEYLVCCTPAYYKEQHEQIV